MRCPLCSSKKKFSRKDLEEHILDHIRDAQDSESMYYEFGKHAAATYKKLFKKDP